MPGSAKVVCFGELMLRLTASASGLLLQTRTLDCTFGGAEANVAVNLARLGLPTAMVTVLPDNALGQTALDELRRFGVDVSNVRSAPGRLGLYFLTPGAVLRPSDILYDRAGSAFAEADPEAVDWDVALDGAARLHVSGVTPAIGRKAADAALRAVAAANRLGVSVSFDGNYRGKMWALWGGDGRDILNGLFAAADVAFATEKDMALVLGQTFDAADARARRRDGAAAAFDAFPRLQVVASTFRDLAGVGEQSLSAALYRRGGGETVFGPMQLSGVVDRIGGGDAFAAGVLYGLETGAGDERAVQLGLAAAAYKHSVPGDFCLATLDELDTILAGGLDVRR